MQRASNTYKNEMYADYEIVHEGNWSFDGIKWIDRLFDIDWVQMIAILIFTLSFIVIVALGSAILNAMTGWATWALMDEKSLKKADFVRQRIEGNDQRKICEDHDSDGDDEHDTDEDCEHIEHLLSDEED